MHLGKDMYGHGAANRIPNNMTAKKITTTAQDITRTQSQQAATTMQKTNTLTFTGIQPSLDE